MASVEWKSGLSVAIIVVVGCQALTCFICQNTIHPDRLDNIKFGAELRREQLITYVKEP